MSSQSLLTKRGQPRARGDGRANYIRGWEAEGFPIGADRGGHSVVKAPALLAQEVFAAHEAWRVIVRVRWVAVWPQHPVGQGPPAVHQGSYPPRGGPPIRRRVQQEGAAAGYISPDGSRAKQRQLGGRHQGAWRIWSVGVLGRADGGLRRAHFPSTSQPSTRIKSWANWSLLVTWAIARKAVAAVWCAIQARHNAFGLEPPLCKPREFTTWKRALEHVMGRPLVLKLPFIDCGAHSMRHVV